MHSTAQFATFTMSGTFDEQIVFTLEAVPENTGLMTSVSYSGQIAPIQLCAMLGHGYACLLEALESERNLPLSYYPLLLMLREQLDQTARDFRQELERYEDTDKSDDIGAFGDWQPPMQ